MTIPRSFLSALPILLAVAAPAASQVTEGGDASGLDVFDFEQVAKPVSPSTPYATVCGPGLTVGERLVGQSLAAAGAFDVVSGTPSVPLAVDASVAAALGVSVYDDVLLGSRIVLGNGSVGWPQADGVGEGSVSLLFAVDQHVLGLTIVGMQDSGAVTAHFYDRGGALVSTLVVAAAVPPPGQAADVVFTSTVPIAAVTLNNVDALGLGYDDVRYDAGDADAWTDLGQGLAGSMGTPVLAGAGAPCGGHPVSVTVSGGLPSSSAALVVGASALGAPFKGGMLVPSPDLVLWGLPLDGAGALALEADWPAGIPAGTGWWFQAWIVDPGAPAGLSASNAVKTTAS